MISITQDAVTTQAYGGIKIQAIIPITLLLKAIPSAQLAIKNDSNKLDPMDRLVPQHRSGMFGLFGQRFRCNSGHPCRALLVIRSANNPMMVIKIPGKDAILGPVAPSVLAYGISGFIWFVVATVSAALVSHLLLPCIIIFIIVIG